MHYVINQQVMTSHWDPVLALLFVGDGSDRSSLSLMNLFTPATIPFSFEESHNDGFPSLSFGIEVLPYQFEPDPPPEPFRSTDNSHACIITDEEDVLSS